MISQKELLLIMLDDKISYYKDKEAYDGNSTYFTVYQLGKITGASDELQKIKEWVERNL